MHWAHKLSVAYPHVSLFHAYVTFSDASAFFFVFLTASPIIKFKFLKPNYWLAADFVLVLFCA